MLHYPAFASAWGWSTLTQVKAAGSRLLYTQVKRETEGGLGMTRTGSEKTAGRTILAAGAFYLIIVLEFFYMATPFAIYFYSAYLPGLDLLNRSSWTAWMTTFFLPHFAPTTSKLVNAAPIIGASLAGIGLLGFAAAAVQVYSRKLRRRGAATGGLYSLMRHPQYAFLILAGAGMLLLWPRYLMVVFFVTMLFAYHALAWIEERECARKFGQTYIDYQDRTPRFLPVRLGLRGIAPFHLSSWPARITAGLMLYLTALVLGLGAAAALQRHTIAHLFAAYPQNAALIAVYPMNAEELKKLSGAALSDPGVRERINNAAITSAPFINYVMPWDWAITEIPMNGAFGHHTPAEHDGRFKIVYTQAALSIIGPATGPDILRYALHTKAAFEVWLDKDGRVVRILDPPDRAFYGEVPVPIY